MKSYSEQVKQQVIERYLSGEASTSILADTGIPKSTFYSWVRNYQEKQKDANQKVVNIRNYHLLERKVARLEGIIEILKAATCTANAPLKQRLSEAEQFYGKYSIHMICDALDIPRGTFYNHVLRSRRIIHGMQNVKKNFEYAYKKSMMKVIRFSVPKRLQQS